MAPSRASSQLQFAAALSTAADSDVAIAEVCDRVGSELGGEADLGMLFVSHHHRDHFDSVAASVADRIAVRCLAGCAGDSIIGGPQEIERAPAVSLWLASLPDVSIWPMHLGYQETPEGGTFTGWHADLPHEWPGESAVILLGDPFTFPIDRFLALLNEDHPGVAVLGGMASGGRAPGENCLFLDRQPVHHGAVALLLHGALSVRSVVSQGCRPIGRHFVITKAHHNVIEELGGKRPLAVLQEIIQDLTDDEKRLVQQGLHVGRVINEYRDHFERGDFLVRNVLGADPSNGAIAIGDLVRPGQTVQFHIRDAATADEELRELLTRTQTAGNPLAALLFTCNGRGTHLFSGPNHDAAQIRDSLGDIPVAGFFAQGELGPVGGENFIHGFTASVVLFQEPAR